MAAYIYQYVYNVVNWEKSLNTSITYIQSLYLYIAPFNFIPFLFVIAQEYQ